MKYAKIQEEELKNKVADDFFGKFDWTEIVGKIDFAVGARQQTVEGRQQFLLWAEAKAAKTDVCEMLTQLVLTIGKARTFDKIIPPPFLGCFDREKIAFVPYHTIQEIFYQNDFNWNVTPSKQDTPQFKQVYELIKGIFHTVIPAKAGIQTEYVNINSLAPRFRGGDESRETYIFDFQKDEKELRQFIRENFVVGKSDITKTRIDKNNFINIYNRWLQAVKPTIAVNWELAKKAGII
ncbi:MAG: hypothetical protein FWE67_15650, partial [Planctomycetaceae bacterium]|nr:hypothetical protein [Planctomycetaceae bacterium]